MLLVINGEEKELPELATVATLVEHLCLKGDRLAVELNRDIVPRASWAATSLKSGDRLEIVHFVGGGCYLRLADD